MEQKKNGRELGLKAESFVKFLCRKYNIPYKEATAEEDCGGGKTDLVVGGKGIQISLQPKSKKQQQKLRRKGVIPFYLFGKTETNLVKELNEICLV